MTMIYAPCPFPTCVSFPSPTLLMPAQDQPSSYKTKACRSFARTGRCPYGPRCRFMHGDVREAQQLAALRLADEHDDLEDREEQQQQRLNGAAAPAAANACVPLPPSSSTFPSLLGSLQQPPGVSTLPGANMPGMADLLAGAGTRSRPGEMSSAASDISDGPLAPGGGGGMPMLPPQQYADAQPRQQLQQPPYHATPPQQIPPAGRALPRETSAPRPPHAVLLPHAQLPLHPPVHGRGGPMTLDDAAKLAAYQQGFADAESRLQQQQQQQQQFLHMQGGGTASPATSGQLPRRANMSPAGSLLPPGSSTATGSLLPSPGSSLMPSTLPSALPSALASPASMQGQQGGPWPPQQTLLPPALLTGATHAASRPLDFQLQAKPASALPAGPSGQTSSVGSSSSTASPAFGPAHAPNAPTPAISAFGAFMGGGGGSCFSGGASAGNPLADGSAGYGSCFGSSNGQAARGVGGGIGGCSSGWSGSASVLYSCGSCDSNSTTSQPSSGWRSSADEPTPHYYSQAVAAAPAAAAAATPVSPAIARNPSRNSSIAKSLAMLFDSDSREGSTLELTSLAGQPSLLPDEPGTASASASTSEASASNSEQLLRTPPRSAGGAAMGACGPLEGKLSIDVEQATASLADQLAAVCCSPPRHQLGAAT